MENDDTVILNPARQSNLARAVAKPRQRWQRKPRARARASVIQHSHKGEDPEDGTARTTMTLNVESESHLSAHEVKELERIVSEAAGDIKGYVRSKTLANRRASRFTAAIAVASIALIALLVSQCSCGWVLLLCIPISAFIFLHLCLNMMLASSSSPALPSATLCAAQHYLE